ncbi:polyketide synthase [Xylaria bambusicola]|uniref:polyketide synthase n=1 Tax=Xylaria bambusicola TaxID=326684 RepID=UPI0020086C90|nr:polyketide synthase [Xylaria bambusicola]KAI0521004.1 polyketide synthase [Xylaria bambusicola]
MATSSDTSSTVAGNDNKTESLVQAVGNATTWEDDPPVIVGIACQMPGDISSPSDLWQFLVDQKSAQGPVPPARYNIDGFYHSQGNMRSGSTHVPGGYFINKDIRQFDNKFFGISNLEATFMDPHQRKLLEVSAECLRSSGTTMESVSGSETGVFVASFCSEHLLSQTRDVDYLHRYSLAGLGTTIMSNRISHVFNLNGPSFSIDTACSSSLYALHQALNAMKAGDCDGAIVASANLIMSVEYHLLLAKAGLLSPTGTCHTFDAAADGYGRAEAASAIYVIRGTAVNACGRTPGISMPSEKMQEAVIRKAYQNAGLEFGGTDYIECHGTGTPVGDPLEVNTVGTCFGRPKGLPPLFIGSVKTNLGHSEAASGLASIIKVVKSFEAGKIAPSYGIQRVNPNLISDERNIRIATKLEEWPRALRRASINSFGYGGANSHVILESTESYLSNETVSQKGVQLNGAHGDDSCTVDAVSNGNHINGFSAALVDISKECLVLPISAASASSLKSLIEQTMQIVAESGDGVNFMKDLAYTLSKGRDTLQHRGYLLATWNENITRYAVSADEKTTVEETKGLPFAFVFGGQGSQYPGMAKDLLLHNAPFRESIRKLDQILKTIPALYRPSWTLEQTILDDPQVSRINEASRSQPVCTAIQIGLIDLLRSWNVQPKYVVGHSSGEIAAAYAADFLDPKQAILAAYFRGYAVSQLRSQGAMMVAALSPEEAVSFIQEKGLQEQARVACINAPTSVTLSGSIDAIETLQSHLQTQQKLVRKLVTGGHAYHSHFMEETSELLEQLLKPLFNEKLMMGDEEKVAPSGVGQVRMYSSVGHSPGALRTMNSRTMGTTYWRHNLEQPVQFCAALANLVTDAGKACLIEIGPHSTLKSPIQQIRKSLGVDEVSLPYLSTLVRNENSNHCLMALAGKLFSQGYPLALEKVNGFGDLAYLTRKPKILHQLPPYPWDYSGGLLWSEPRTSTAMRNRKHVRHELLGTAALIDTGFDFTWHNILKPNEMPWIKDHKLGERVLFPAAGYVAMAIEAVMQIAGIKKQLEDNHDRNLGFELRNVRFNAALTVPDESENTSKELELHTTMSPRKISGVSTSVDWHDFSIVSSYSTSNLSIVHCTGSIRITKGRKQIYKPSATVQEAEGFDFWPSMAKWYHATREAGLCFGPNFQSLTTMRADSARKRPEVIATTRITPASVGSTYEYYPVHPIAIDAGLQAAVLSGASGNIAAVGAWLPVFIAEAHIQPSIHSENEAEGEIYAKSEEMGFSSRRIDVTLRDASGALVVEYVDSRLALYNGKGDLSIAQQTEASETAYPGKVKPASVFLQRQPTLRVQWKPDILRIDSKSSLQLSRYLIEYLERQDLDVRDDESLAIIGGLLELAGHKNPRIRILEVGGDAEGYKAKIWQRMLGKQTAFPRFRSWHAALLGNNGQILVEDSIEGPFGVVLVPKHTTSNNHFLWKNREGCIASLVSGNGVVITRRSDAAVSFLREAGFEVLDLRNHVILAVRTAQETIRRGRRAFIIQNESPSISMSEFATMLSTYLEEHVGISDASVISLSHLDTVEIAETDLCISLLEAEREFLPVIDSKAMNRLRRVTDNTNSLLWITGANMLGDEPNPNLTLANGLSRAVMLEQPSLRWSILDVGKQLTDPPNAVNVLVSIVKALDAKQEMDDCEYILMDSLLFVSRYSPDFQVNSLFRQRMNPQTAELEERRLAEAKPVRLTISRPGALDTIHFEELREPGWTEGLASGYVDVEVKTVSLNAKDVYVMAGRVETPGKTTAFDFAGIVSAVGPGTSGLKVGDRVVACAAFQIGTTARVRTDCVLPLLDNEDFTVMPTLTITYGTALYALENRAHLRKGESILVHCGSGGVGIAVITLARKMGATVYTTCGSQGKREYLVKELGVPASHIFSSRDSSFVRGIAELTSGRGVDVIINSLVGDLMHDSWESCLAEFGRFVEIGKRELVNAGRLNMRMFLRNATFTAFDLSTLLSSEDPYNRATCRRLMVDTIGLYRAGDISPPPIKVFDITEVAQAYRYFNHKDRVGKVVISMENPQSAVPVSPALYSSTFDPEKIYLLIGCLGGLGRSLSRWMMSRGARHFVFLGRSGADKPSAKQLVNKLEQAGATTCVIRGDVCQVTDVEAAVTHCVSTGRRLGGVVQAAMGLHEALFTSMSTQAWHTGIDPKYQGTWNLHNSLEGHKLDFFMLTSSLLGTVGVATESNYCSANSFLDAFARWRRSRGLPCVSVGLGMISEVGYLHEHPEIGRLVLRKGTKPLNEDDFLQIVDLALASEADGSINKSHMLTGLETASALELSARGIDITHQGAVVDTRSLLQLASIQAAQEAANTASSQLGGDSITGPATIAPWFKDIPTSLATSFSPVASAGSLQEAVMQLCKKQFSNLLSMPINEVDHSKALLSFGVDSMTASEFRSWFWAKFRVDVPYLDIMSPHKSLRELAEHVQVKLQENGA